MNERADTVIIMDYFMKKYDYIMRMLKEYE